MIEVFAKRSIKGIRHRLVSHIGYDLMARMPKLKDILDREKVKGPTSVVRIDIRFARIGIQTSDSSLHSLTGTRNVRGLTRFVLGISD